MVIIMVLSSLLLLSLFSSTEDDVTIKLRDIIFANDIIHRHRTTGAKVEMILVSSLLLFLTSSKSNMYPVTVTVP